jgi:hypothetical protein
MIRTVTKILLLATILLCVVSIIFHKRHTEAVPATAVPVAPSVVSAVSAVHSRALRRPVYPYSLIPGGVSGVASLKAAMASDPRLAAQFPGFAFSRARVIHLQGRLAYVSFRKNGQVSWTNKLQRLADDDVITDGTYTIRMRCGNGVSYLPQVPTDPAITSDLLDTPIPGASVPNAPDVPQLTGTPAGPQIEVDALPPPPAGQLPGVAPLPPVYIASGQPFTPRSSPIAIPEPPAWQFTLLALGAIAGLLFVGRFWRRSKPFTK